MNNGAAPDVEAVFLFSVKIQILELLLYLPPVFFRDILTAGANPEFENTGRHQKHRPGDGMDSGARFIDFQMLGLNITNQSLPEGFA